MTLRSTTRELERLAEGARRELRHREGFFDGLHGRPRIPYPTTGRGSFYHDGYDRGARWREPLPDELEDLSAELEGSPLFPRPTLRPEDLEGVVPPPLGFLGIVDASIAAGEFDGLASEPLDGVVFLDGAAAGDPPAGELQEDQLPAPGPNPLGEDVVQDPPDVLHDPSSGE